MSLKLYDTRNTKNCGRMLVSKLTERRSTRTLRVYILYVARIYFLALISAGDGGIISALIFVRSLLFAYLSFIVLPFSFGFC